MATPLAAASAYASVARIASDANSLALARQPAGDAAGGASFATVLKDAIGSVASYFKGYGWNPGMPTHYPVRFDQARLDLDALLAPDILPTFNVTRFQELGAVIEEPALAHPGPLALIELQNGSDPPTYVAGSENFYVITRYNWSSYYAMAVIELGREVKEALGRQSARNP